MAAFDTNRSVTVMSAGRVNSAVANFFGTLVAWNEERATTKALSNLSARQLDDIGLCYGDISKIAKSHR